MRNLIKDYPDKLQWLEMGIPFLDHPHGNPNAAVFHLAMEVEDVESIIERRVREAVGCTYAAMCAYAMNGRDIAQVEFPEIAEGVLKALDFADV